jgi:serine/threonine protein kinase
VLRDGQTILHFRVLGKIGQGGMGEVYKAEDQKLGRTVALKFLPRDAAEDERQSAAFFRKRAQHPL